MVCPNLVQLPVPDDIRNEAGKVPRIRRRANLVRYDTEALAAPCQFRHCLHEILPEGREHPGGPYYDAFTAAFADCLFAKELCRPIGSKRLRGPVLAGRHRKAAGENIVRRDMNKGNPPFDALRSKDPRGNVIQKVSHSLVRLRLLDIRVCGAVDDKVYLLRVKDKGDGIGIRDIQVKGFFAPEACHVGENEPVPAAGGDESQFPAQLAVCSGD